MNGKGRPTAKDYLIEALLSLAEEDGLEKVTVTSLCNRALVNRSTFYAKYIDKEDFIDKVLKEVTKGFIIESSHEFSAFFESQEYIVAHFTRWFEYAENNQRFLRVMLGPKGTPKLDKLIRDTGISWHLQFLRPMASALNGYVSPDVYASYIASAHIGLLHAFLRGDMPYSCHEMAQQLCRLTYFNSPILQNIWRDCNR